MFLFLFACTPLTCGPGTHVVATQCVADSEKDPVEESKIPDSPEGDSDSDTGEPVAPLEVYLLAGQSNMDGYGYVSGLPPSLRLPQAGVILYRGAVPGPLTPDSTGGSAYVGPEVAFGARLAAEGREVALVKHAVSGTDLATFWYPGETTGATDVGQGWAGLESELHAAATDLDARGRPWKWAGFVWMQGESDAGSPDWAASYDNNLTRLIRRVREETGEAELPVVLGLIACEQLCTWSEEVRAAQQAVADADPAVQVVETLDLPRNVRDPWHYDGPSERVLGQRFAEALLGLPISPAPSAALQIDSYRLDYDGDFTVGWTFHVDLPLRITDMGSFTADGYLYTSAPWAIWDSSGQMIAQGDVPAWSEQPTSYRNFFGYTAIEELRLAPGDYRIGLQTWSWDYDRYANGVLGSEATGLSYTGAAYHAGAWLSYPEVTNAGTSANMAFLGPNFLFQPD